MLPLRFGRAPLSPPGSLDFQAHKQNKTCNTWYKTTRPSHQIVNHVLDALNAQSTAILRPKITRFFCIKTTSATGGYSAPLLKLTMPVIRATDLYFSTVVVLITGKTLASLEPPPPAAAATAPASPPRYPHYLALPTPRPNMSKYATNDSKRSAF